MANRNTILNELQGLGSTLVNLPPPNIYQVPDGYFEELAGQILNRVKALEASTAKEELEILSPALDSVPKEIPFTVPAGYFENLSERMMQGIREHADYQTSDEEIASLSPLLSGISKKSTYSIPAGYFEKLNPGIEKKEAKVISIAGRRWYRFAAAASIIGIIAIGSIVFFNQKSIDPNKNPQAWMKKNVNKKVSQEKLDEFVTLAKEDENFNSPNDNEAVRSDEVKELMKDVSEKELQEFLNEAVALESNDATDVLMN